jgi:transcriptional regulator with XRE-family HTH domain
MKLQEVRSERDLSQWDLKLLTNIHQTKISLIESGYVIPTAEERRKLARALGVDPGELAFELKSFVGTHLSADSVAQQKFKEA